MQKRLSMTFDPRLAFEQSDKDDCTMEPVKEK